MAEDTPASAPDGNELAQFRSYLMRYALLQLRDQTAADLGEAALVDALFVKNGHWTRPPASWGSPDQSFENSRFWEAFEMCSKLMPEKTARVFVMREVMDRTTEEICKEMNITATHCWVILHRARLSLRSCLDIHWFGTSR